MLSFLISMEVTKAKGSLRMPRLLYPFVHRERTVNVLGESILCTLFVAKGMKYIICRTMRPLGFIFL